MITIKVTAVDNYRSSISDTFDLTINNINDAPELINLISDQTVPEDVYCDFSFNTNTFNDVDDEDLTYSAILSNGNPLPSWLNFYGPTINFSGTPTNDDVGTITIKLIANDSSNLSAYDSFHLIVSQVNDPPVISDIDDQLIPEGATFTPIILDDFVTDIDHDDSLITWTAMGQVDLTITITDRIASILQPHDKWNGIETIIFMAEDPEGLTSTDIVVFTVIPKPVVTNLSNDVNPAKIKSWTWSSNTDCTFRFEINQNPSWQPTGTFQTIQTATKSDSDGKWYIHVQAKNKYDDVSDVVTVFAILDNTKPVITGIEDDPMPCKNKTWTWNVDDASECLFRYVIDQNNTWIPSGEYNTYTTATKLGYGQWYIHVEAIDRAGNVSDIVSGSAQLIKPSIQFNAMFSEGDESISHITLELNLSHISSDEITVEYTTKNDQSLEQANRNIDYNLPDENIVFIEPGEQKGFIELTIIDDLISENDEQCVIQLHSPSHSVMLDETDHYTYTILDNDHAGLSIFESDGLSEVSESGIPDSFTVVLNTEPLDTINLMMNTDQQITLSPEYLVFTPENWNQEQNVTIAAVDDDIYELEPHNDLISFSIENNVLKYKDLKIDDISVHITDNEQPPTVMFVNSFFEGDESVSPVQLPIILSHRANKDVIIEYENINSGTASEDRDFILDLSYKTSIKAFELQGSIEVDIINDSISESSETIRLEIIRSEIAFIGKKNACEYLIKNDDFPGVSINGISASNYLLEGETFSYSIVLRSQPDSRVTLRISVDDESILNFSQKELNFYPNTWNIPQYVSCTIFDDNFYYDSLKAKITHQSFIDPVYSVLPHKEIVIIVKDNDPEPSPPKISGKSLTNEEMVIWNIESGGGNGNLTCKSDEQIILCSLGTMSTYLSEGKHMITVKEEISLGQWTQEASFELEKDMGMPCSQVYAPAAITAENIAFTITYSHEDKYHCQTYINKECGTGTDHCPGLFDRGSGVNEIQLWVQMPDSNEFTFIDSDTDESIDGYFTYTATHEGLYRFYTRAIDKATNAEPIPFQPYSHKIAETLYIKNFSGYAIIAVGSVSGQEGLESHTLTANNIYKHLIHRNFWPEHIKYFNPYEEIQPGETDYMEHGKTYSDAFENVITQWAPEQIKKLSGPLYIILIDHGSPDIFHLTGTQSLSAFKLNQYLYDLDVLENKEEIIIILGTCFSGSFIDDIATKGRIVVTSAAANEPSYRGPKINPGGVRDGGFFISNLFNELAKGNNLMNSFNTAVLRTESFTFNFNTSSKAPFNDFALQHPLLDDNGKDGSNFLPLNGDGIIAQNIILGHNEKNAVEILHTTIAPKQLNHNENTLNFEVIVNDIDNVKRVWIEVRKPDVRLEDMRLKHLYDNIGLQQSVELEEYDMAFHPQKRSYKLISDCFDTPGQYIVFFYVKDKEGLTSTYKEEIIYKNKENNKPPLPFHPISPMNIDGTEFSDIIFEWENTRDPENDRFTYSLILSTDTDSFIKERIFETICFVSLPKSWDKKDVLWKVQAIDNYGNITETPQWTFKIDNNVDNWGSIVYFQVYDMDTQMPVPKATVNLSSNDMNLSLEVNSNGLYIERFMQSGLYNISVIADNYTPLHKDPIEIIPGEMQSFNFSLDFQSSLGDINRNGKRDIGDAIQCLQVLSGLADQSYYDRSALLGDALELRDTIYILQHLSDIK